LAGGQPGKIPREIESENIKPGGRGGLVKSYSGNLKKRRPWGHHQFLSTYIGQPDLRDRLLQVIAVLSASAYWHFFKRLFARSFPRKGDQIPLDIPPPKEEQGE
jgi:hypothetical protein